jgi:hypothetical protein
LRLAGGFGLAVLLSVGAGQGGTTAVQANPRSVAVHSDHRARPAPQQRWGSAAGLEPVVAGPRNRTVPPSLRAKYPPIKAPSLPANSARVVAAPAAHPRTGYNAATSREVPAKRQARQRTYDNADGTQTTEFSASALNYRKRDGTWAPIDSTLVPAGDTTGGSCPAGPTEVRRTGDGDIDRRHPRTSRDRPAGRFDEAGTHRLRPCCRPRPAWPPLAQRSNSSLT